MVALRVENNKIIEDLIAIEVYIKIPKGPIYIKVLINYRV